MVPTVAIVYFLHHFLSLVRTETSQIQVGVEIGIEFLVLGVLEKCVLGDQVLELLCLCPVVGNCSVFQVGDDGVSPLWCSIEV